MTTKELAEMVRDIYLERPELPSLAVADEIGVPLSQVWSVLDEYEVLADGTVQHNGPGQGGGWVPAVMTTEQDVGQHIGYRWLDGSIHDEVDPQIMKMIEDFRAEQEND